ncbi:MAG: hypothetical protein ACLRXQ_06105 [Phascolarctobacterium faecium]
MDKYLQIIASASLFRGIAKTEIAAVPAESGCAAEGLSRNKLYLAAGRQSR